MGGGGGGGRGSWRPRTRGVAPPGPVRQLHQCLGAPNAWGPARMKTQEAQRSMARSNHTAPGGHRLERPGGCMPRALQPDTPRTGYGSGSTAAEDWARLRCAKFGRSTYRPLQTAAPPPPPPTPSVLSLTSAGTPCLGKRSTDGRRPPDSPPKRSRCIAPDTAPAALPQTTAVSWPTDRRGSLPSSITRPFHQDFNAVSWP